MLGCLYVRLERKTLEHSNLVYNLSCGATVYGHHDFPEVSELWQRTTSEVDGRETIDGNMTFLVLR